MTEHVHYNVLFYVCQMYIYTKNRSLKTCTFKEVNVHLILLKSTIFFDHTR